MDERRINKKRKKDKDESENSSQSTEEQKMENAHQYETPIDLNHLNKEELSTIYSSATLFGLHKSSSKTTPSLSNTLKRNLFNTAQQLQNTSLFLQKSNSVPSHLRTLKQLQQKEEKKEENNTNLLNVPNYSPDSQFDDLEGYKIDDEIGYGTFSTVYKATCTKTGQTVAIKRIIPTCKPSRILSEIEFIRKLSGKKNIVQMLGGIRKDYQISLVLSYLDHQSFKDFKDSATIPQIKEYMKGLLIALYHVHENGIIHRDVKPSNFLSNIETKQFLLVDFGLAQCVNDIKLKSSMNSIPSRAGTRGFRAPEVLLKCVEQTTAIDLWSAGVILLSLVTKRYPFFQSPDDLTSIVEIANLCGSQKLVQVAEKLNKILTLPCEFPGISYKDLVSRLNPSFDLSASEHIIDLLAQLLEIDPSKRITAKNALRHPFIRGK